MKTLKIKRNNINTLFKRKSGSMKDKRMKRIKNKDNVKKWIDEHE